MCKWLIQFNIFYSKLFYNRITLILRSSVAKFQLVSRKSMLSENNILLCVDSMTMMPV